MNRVSMYRKHFLLKYLLNYLTCFKPNLSYFLTFHCISGILVYKVIGSTSAGSVLVLFIQPAGANFNISFVFIHFVTVSTFKICVNTLRFEFFSWNKLCYAYLNRYLTKFLASALLLIQPLNGGQSHNLLPSKKKNIYIPLHLRNLQDERFAISFVFEKSEGFGSRTQLVISWSQTRRIVISINWMSFNLSQHGFLLD